MKLNILPIISLISTLSTSNLYVLTPNGSQVTVLEYNDDLLDQDDIDEIIAEEVSLIGSSSYERLDDPTYHYNCHSYAWYSQSTSNTYWMDDPSSYVSDGSYVESTGLAGEIAVYYSKMGGVFVHSAVINYRFNDGSNVSNLLVDSKWGRGSLYRTKGNVNPYVYGDVKYYRLNSSHTHDYTYNYVWQSYTKHKAYCSCGSFITQGHFISGDVSLSSTYYTCLACGGSATVGFALSSLNEELNSVETDTLTSLATDFSINDNKVETLESTIYMGLVFLNDEDMEYFLKNNEKEIYYIS